MQKYNVDLKVGATFRMSIRIRRTADNTYVTNVGQTLRFRMWSSDKYDRTFPMTYVDGVWTIELPPNVTQTYRTTALYSYRIEAVYTGGEVQPKLSGTLRVKK